MRSFDTVVQTLVRSMIGIGCQRPYRPDVAAKFVRHDDTRMTKARDKALQKALCCFGASILQNQDIKYIAGGIDSAPKPELLAVDQNDDFIEVPFVSTARPFALDAIREMMAKPVHPETNGFTAHDHAAFRQQVFDICRAQSKPVIGPYRISDDLSWEAKAL